MVVVADLDRPEADGPDAHHLGRVLRLRSGEVVVAGDGAGRWRTCRWTAPGRLEADGEVVVEAAAHPALTVAFVPTKGDRPEWVVQKLTELGVDRIVVATSARSVVRWDGPRVDRHLARLAEVARQASAQSRRVHLPVVDGVVPVASLLSGGVAVAVPGGPPPDLSHPAVLVGPEGGWSVEEEAAAAHTVGLGPGVLRAETAAVAAGALLAALRAGLVHPAAPGG